MWAAMGWGSEASDSLGQNGCVAKTSHGSSRAPGSRVRERETERDRETDRKRREERAERRRDPVYILSLFPLSIK